MDTGRTISTRVRACRWWVLISTDVGAPFALTRSLARLLARQVHKEGNTVYGEVQAMVTLLGYKTANAGCCSVLLHPRWGSSVYPASFFAKAPLDEVEHAIATCRKSSLE